MRVCGGCYRRLGRSAEPELEAAVRCETEQATPHVSRKRQAAGGAREENAIAAEPNHGPNETETYSGFSQRVTKVYGEGCFHPPTSGVKMLITGSRDTTHEMTTAGAGGQRKLTVAESYREDIRVGISGGAKGLVTRLVARIFGVYEGTFARCVTECGDGKNPKKKIKAQERRCPYV